MRHAVATREQLFGPEHPFVPRGHVEVATLLARAGRTEEAQALARVVLPQCERILGSDHPETLRARRVLEA
ncbi:tetratricopeptide repeat protein [Streptomyces sp. MCAF7]